MTHELRNLHPYWRWGSSVLVAKNVSQRSSAQRQHRLVTRYPGRITYRNSPEIPHQKLIRQSPKIFSTHIRLTFRQHTRKTVALQNQNSSVFRTDGALCEHFCKHDQQIRATRPTPYHGVCPAKCCCRACYLWQCRVHHCCYR